MYMVSRPDYKHAVPNSLQEAAPSSNQSQLSNAQITSLFGQSQSSPAPQLFSPPLAIFNSPPTPNLIQTTQHISPKADPFASLTSSHNSRQASPFQFQQSTQPPSQLAAKPPQNPQPSLISTSSAAADDEWNFESALPPSDSYNMSLTNSSINISWELSRPGNQPGVIEIKSKVSNLTAAPVSNFTFQVAVTKAYSLGLQPQSSLNLAPHQKDGITQVISLTTVSPGQGSSVRMRWKAGYSLGAERKEESGSIDGLPAGL